MLPSSGVSLYESDLTGELCRGEETGLIGGGGLERTKNRILFFSWCQKPTIHLKCAVTSPMMTSWVEGGSIAT
jgi:hypothetical protein